MLRAIFYFRPQTGCAGPLETLQTRQLEPVETHTHTHSKHQVSGGLVVAATFRKRKFSPVRVPNKCCGYPAVSILHFDCTTCSDTFALRIVFDRKGSEAGFCLPSTRIKIHLVVRIVRLCTRTSNECEQRQPRRQQDVKRDRAHILFARVRVRVSRKLLKSGRKKNLEKQVCMIHVS